MLAGRQKCKLALRRMDIGFWCWILHGSDVQPGWKPVSCRQPVLELHWLPGFYRPYNNPISEMCRKPTSYKIPILDRCRLDIGCLHHTRFQPESNIGQMLETSKALFITGCFSSFKSRTSIRKSCLKLWEAMLTKASKGKVNISQSRQK